MKLHVGKLTSPSRVSDPVFVRISVNMQMFLGHAVFELFPSVAIEHLSDHDYLDVNLKYTHSNNCCEILRGDKCIIVSVL